jgi:hypothetical protein
MEAKFCPKCGASVPENANFCLSCGTNLTMLSAPPAANITSPVKPADLEVSAARMKSYNGTAILVFFLYFLFYFPGLIVNFIYYQEAKKMEETAGMSLPGVGLLSIMLWINVAVVALSFLITVFIMMGLFGN